MAAGCKRVMASSTVRAAFRPKAWAQHETAAQGEIAEPHEFVAQHALVEQHEFPERDAPPVWLPYEPPVECYELRALQPLPDGRLLLHG